MRIIGAESGRVNVLYGVAVGLADGVPDVAGLALTGVRPGVATAVAVATETTTIFVGFGVGCTAVGAAGGGGSGATTGPEECRPVVGVVFT